jgi:hypothetical protein
VVMSCMVQRRFSLHVSVLRVAAQAALRLKLEASAGKIEAEQLHALVCCGRYSQRCSNMSCRAIHSLVGGPRPLAMLSCR